MREFTEENDRNEPLFDLFKNTLCEIADKGDPTVNTIAFEVQLLALLGYLPEMSCCASCKAKMDAKSLSTFSASEGGVLCADCSRRIREKVKISGGSIATINYLAGKKVQDLGADEIRRAESRYLFAPVPDGEFTAADGTTHRLSEIWDERPILINLFYRRCTGAAARYCAVSRGAVEAVGGLGSDIRW